MLAGFSGLLIALTTNRERGILKRYRGTPMPPWVFLSAQILQTLTTIVVMAITIVVIGWAAYDVHPVRSALGAFVLYVVLGTATMCALGIAVTRITTTADSASAIGPFAAVILSFISGVFIPVASLPAWLRDVGRVFPLAHLAEGLQRTYSPATLGQRYRRDERRGARRVGTDRARGGAAHLQMGAAGHRGVTGVSSLPSRSCWSRGASTIAGVMRAGNSSTRART